MDKRIFIVFLFSMFLNRVNAQFTATTRNETCFETCDGSVTITPSTGYIYKW
ncbi:MAG: hypothetical protein JWO06_2684, partial [Bacteroidota bacterium]|nr:hypothetical protein [Bacteroidota bacterium]